ncbi:MAG TPA: response regulator [Acidimicrobiales bacterium]|nr:response regulator [Acidimicrobiales bacterium]
MPEDSNMFLDEGDFWTIRYASKSFRLKSSKGLQYIATLLRHPGQEVHVLELVGAAGGAASPRGTGRTGADVRSLDSEGLRVGGLGDAGDMLDAKAKAAYRRRLTELQEDLSEAEAFNDSERAARAYEEIDALEQQLSAAFGLGGRARKTGSAAERARVNVRNTIASAMKAIAVHGPELAEHLKKSIRTGTFCWYAGDGVKWVLEQLDGAAAAAIARAPFGSGDDERLVATFLFTDIVDSTKRAAAGGDRAWRKAMDRHDAVASEHLAAHCGIQVRSMGDGLLAVFESPAAAISCALSLHEAMDGLGLPIRAGIHTGECSRRAEDFSGIGVNIAARIMAEAEGGETLVSSTVTEIVAGSGIEFRDHGFHTLRGVPGSWRLFAVAGTTTASSKRSKRPTHHPLSLMVVDDHPMWRQTLRTVLESSGVGIVVAEASDGEEVVELALSARPEAVIMDMNLLTISGVEATRRLLDVMPETKVLMLSSSDERQDVVEAVKAGASGYLLKTAEPDEVADAVQRIRGGELVFPPALAKVVLDEFRRIGRTDAPRATKSAAKKKQRA